MHQLFTYQGISQLLAFSPWKKYPKQTHNSINLQNQIHIHLSKSPKIGFVPFKTNQSESKLASDIDSQLVEKDQDSSNSDSKPQLIQSSQKKRQSQQGKTRKGPYKKYTTQQKQQAIQLINSGKDIKSVSKQFNIPRRNLLRWRKNGCQRKQGGGRPSDFIMQQKLFDMILKKEVTSEKQIREYALNMTNFKKFKASKGWYVKFWRRFHEYKERLGKEQEIKDSIQKIEQ